MSNVHRLHVPKLRRTGGTKCVLSDELTMRDIAALQQIGLIAIHRHGVLHIERARHNGDSK